MSYSPPVSKQGSFGVSSQAKVESKDGKFRITMKDRDGNVSDPIILSASNAPENLFAGIHYLQLSDDKSKVVNFRPWSGMYRVQVDQFASKKDEKPSPRTGGYTFKDKSGKPRKASYQYFTPLLKVIQGEYKDCIVPYRLRYNFTEMKQEINGEMQDVVGLMGGKYGEQLGEFLDITGAWNNGSIPAKAIDNVLPGLERRILHENQSFNILMKDGWIDAIFADNRPTEEPEDF